MFKRITIFAIGYVAGATVAHRIEADRRAEAVKPQADETSDDAARNYPPEHQPIVDLLGYNLYKATIDSFGAPPSEVVGAATRMGASIKGLRADIDAAKTAPTPPFGQMPDFSGLQFPSMDKMLDDIKEALASAGPLFRNEFAIQAAEHRCPAHPEGLLVDDLLPPAEDQPSFEEFAERPTYVSQQTQKQADDDLLSGIDDEE